MNNVAYIAYIIYDYRSVEGWVARDYHAAITFSAHEAKLFSSEELAENYCEVFKECTISIRKIEFPRG